MIVIFFMINADAVAKCAMYSILYDHSFSFIAYFIASANFISTSVFSSLVEV